MDGHSINKRALLQCLSSYGETTVGQLAEILQLPEFVILDLAEELKSGRFIKEIGKTRDDTQRAFTLNLDYYLAMGIDVTTIGEINAVLCDIKGNTVFTAKRRYTDKTLHPDGEIMDIVDEMLAYADEHAKNLVGIGVAIAGLVNPVKRQVLFSNCIEFPETSLWDDLAAKTGLPVSIDSEANAVSIAQWERSQAIEKVRNLLCVSIGQNIDAGIIRQGDIYYGDLFSSGLVGHIVVEPDGKQCICGLRGCLDTVVQRDPDTGIINANATGKHLGHALGVFANMYNINNIIISAHEALSDAFWQELNRSFTAHTMHFVRQKTVLQRSLIEQNAVAIGAATIVLRDLLNFAGHIPTDPTTMGEAHQNEVVSHILRFIQDHYRDDISLTDIADHMQLNPQYISRLFKTVTGENFLNHLNILRIEKSKKLIENTDYTMAKIASIIGFTNEQKFTRHFRKFEGCTPARWRELSKTGIVK